jgi:hypothetical protein
MPWVDRPVDQARASAIWPTAAAAWLSSSLQRPGGQAEHGAAQRDGAGRDHQNLGAGLLELGNVGAE